MLRCAFWFDRPSPRIPATVQSIPTDNFSSRRSTSIWPLPLITNEATSWMSINSLVHKCCAHGLSRWHMRDGSHEVEIQPNPDPDTGLDGGSDGPVSGRAV